MLREHLKKIVGEKGWSTDAAVLEPHLTEGRGRLRGETLIMVSPNTTAQVSEVVKACATEGVGVVEDLLHRLQNPLHAYRLQERLH